MSGQPFRYVHGDSEQLGHIVAPEGTRGPQPTVLVNHAWGGLRDFERDKCEYLASLGYTAIALDNFGEGRTGAGKEECSALIAPLMQDRKLLRERLLAGYEAAKDHPTVDAERVAAIGFCFGGLCALDLARSGAPLRGVASFHGLLKPSGLPPQRISASVLVLHGYDDPMAPPDELTALQQELTQAGCDWQVHSYGNTVHGFTNPAANDPDFGVVYSPRAERRSLDSLESFLGEVLN